MARKSGMPRGLVIIAVLAYCAVSWYGLFHFGKAAVDWAMGASQPVTADKQ